MTYRHWDPDQRFVGAELRRYRFWALELSMFQHTLGAFIIFFLKPGTRLESSLSDPEWCELKYIKWDMEHALKSAPDFRPDHFVYLPGDNAMPSLHSHGIPRYKSDRPFNGTVWRDPDFEEPPVLTRELSSGTRVIAIRDALKPYLPR